MTKGKILAVIVAIVLFSGGLALLFRPSRRTAEEQSRSDQVIREFQTYLQEEMPTALPGTPAAPQRAFPQLWEACQEYNRSIAADHQAFFSQDTISQPQLCLADYGWEQDSFGYLSIPAASIEQPLYLGSSAVNLDKGGAVLGQTSLPIGGEDTHTVIVGHRTWDTAVKFEGLEQLTEGDLVYLTNPWETLTYSVIDVKIIQPNETDRLLIQNGRDLLSLITCTYPNTRRVLVICERATDS